MRRFVVRPELAAIADNLAADPGPRREDVIVSAVEVKKENRSFGNGIARCAG